MLARVVRGVRSLEITEDRRCQIVPPASSPTLCRLENRATPAQALALHGALVEQFIASQPTAPTERVLDIDASDVTLHGRQELAKFHAYYDQHC